MLPTPAILDWSSRNDLIGRRADLARSLSSFPAIVMASGPNDLQRASMSRTVSPAVIPPNRRGSRKTIRLIESSSLFVDRGWRWKSERLMRSGPQWVISTPQMTCRCFPSMPVGAAPCSSVTPPVMPSWTISARGGERWCRQRQGHAERPHRSGGFLSVVRRRSVVAGRRRRRARRRAKARAKGAGSRLRAVQA